MCGVTWNGRQLIRRNGTMKRPDLERELRTLEDTLHTLEGTQCQSVIRSLRADRDQMRARMRVLKIRGPVACEED